MLKDINFEAIGALVADLAVYTERLDEVLTVARGVKSPALKAALERLDAHEKALRESLSSLGGAK